MAQEPTVQEHAYTYMHNTTATYVHAQYIRGVTQWMHMYMYVYMNGQLKQPLTCTQIHVHVGGQSHNICTYIEVQRIVTLIWSSASVVLISYTPCEVGRRRECKEPHAKPYKTLRTVMLSNALCDCVCGKSTTIIICTCIAPYSQKRSCMGIFIEI